MKSAKVLLFGVVSILSIATTVQAQIDNAISYPLKNARADQVVTMIQQLAGSSFRVAADQRTNAVVVVGKPADHQMAGMLVERLDLPPTDAANTVLMELHESLQGKQLDASLEQLAKSLQLNIIQAKHQQTHLLVQGPAASRTQFQQLLSQFGQKVAEVERGESRMLRVAILQNRDHEISPIHADTAAQALLDKVEKLGFGKFELTAQCLVRCKIGPQKQPFEIEGSLSSDMPFKLSGQTKLGEHNDSFKVDLTLTLGREHQSDHPRHRPSGKSKAVVQGNATMPLRNWSVIGSTLIDGQTLLVMAQMLPETLN